MKRKINLSKPRIGKGDYGFTDFIGTAIAHKSSWQAEACGTVEELNTIIGEAYARIKEERVQSVLLQISKDLFVLGTDIAMTMMSEKKLPRITTKHIHRIEEWMSLYERGLPRIAHFVVPIGPANVTILHQARAVCRRAERQMVKFMKNDKTDRRNNPLTLAYLNRLGDLLFVMARLILKKSGIKETYWSRKDALTER